MSLKQDRQPARTVPDLERKYNFGKSFAEILGIATDARDAAEEAKQNVEILDTSLSADEIFNRLTDYGTAQGIYRENGEIYINANFIKTGFISSDLIKAGKIRSTDFEATTAEKLYPSSTLFPGVALYPNNGEQIIRGLEIDFEEGVIRGVLTNEVLEDRIETLEKGLGGYGGAAVRLSTSKIESESALETAIESIYSGMGSSETKLVRWLGYPAGDYNWYGILAKSSANYGSLEVQSAYGKGSLILKAKSGGSWQPLEWVNPPMVAGTEYRTTERWNDKPVYAKLINVGYVSKGDNTFAHNTGVYTPISCDVMNNTQDWLNGSNLITNLSVNRTNIYFNCTSNFGNIQFLLKYTKE